MDEKLRQAIRAEWVKIPEDCRYPPASEDQLLQFEQSFSPIPAEFRWFLATCGGGPSGSEWIDGIEQLTESHLKFRSESLPGGWTMTNVFIIGWDGGGNPYGIHRESGRILVEDHQFGGIQVMAESFSALLIQRLRIH